MHRVDWGEQRGMRQLKSEPGALSCPTGFCGASPGGYAVTGSRTGGAPLIGDGPDAMAESASVPL